MPAKLSIVQFSLRSLFVILTAIAIGLGIWTNSARRQHDLVEAVETEGGIVGYGRDDRSLSPLWSAVERMLGKDYVRSVEWIQMPSLLPGEDMHDDAHLPAVSQLPKLEKLYLNGTSIADADLAEIGHCASLVELRVADTSITDAGIHYLEHLGSLTTLDLSGTRVSNAAAPRLQQLHSLKSLILDRTRCDEDGVQTLRQELRGCVIHFRTRGA